MPIDPRTGEQVDSLPAMDAEGRVSTPREVRQLRKALRQQVDVMFSALDELHPPHPDSLLARLERDAFTREPPSVIIMNALVSACAHLVSAHDFFKTNGANRITAWSLLRPALMSATTAGWVLIGTDDQERLRRAAVVVNESMRYELAYANNVVRIPGGQAEERKAMLEERVEDLNKWADNAGVKLKRSDSVPMTAAVREVAEAVDDEDEARLSALWNEMSSGAHGLGWHIRSRTFGTGTTPLAGSRFYRFPVDLDRAYYFGAVATITNYTNAILSLARAFATDATTLAENGMLAFGADGELVLKLALPSLWRRDD